MFFVFFLGGGAGGKGLKVIVPQFNGSFTFEVETHVPERTARWVRMVLMDHYKGAETMEEKIGRARTIDGTVDHVMLPDEKTRLDILRKVSEASNKMWWNVNLAAGWLLNTFSDLKGEGFMPLPPWLFPAEVSQRGIGEVVRKRVEGIKRKQVPRASFPSPSTRDVDESAERRL